MRRTKFSVLTVGLLLSTAVFAVPSQQLDLTGGAYDDGDETVILEGATDFQLVAATTVNQNEGGGRLTPSELQSETFYLTISFLGLAEGDGVTAPDIGSIMVTVGGTTFFIDSSDLAFGLAPTGDDMKMGNFEIAPHDIYPLWFAEIQYTITDMFACQTYNTQNDAGLGATADVNGGSFCTEFDISLNLTNIDITAIHFDTYTLNCDGIGETCTDQTIHTFAPFSKDAEVRVPEPDTLALLALGLLALALSRRRPPNV